MHGSNSILHSVRKLKKSVNVLQPKDFLGRYTSPSSFSGKTDLCSKPTRDGGCDGG